MVIIQAVDIAFTVLKGLLIVRILLSWIKHNPYHPIIKFIYETTEPILGPFRKIIPPLGVVDISPIVAFFAVELARYVVIILLSSII